MDYAELSDLEEGEILEYYSVSPTDAAGAHFGIRNFSSEGLRTGGRSKQCGLKENKDLYSGQSDGYTNQTLKEKLKLNEKFVGNNLNINMIDLESISSDGEYRSDEENKNSASENKYSIYNNAENKAKGAFYGTVEDIMSEIGETICRNSRCNYKKRKSKDLKQNLDKCSATSYDLWRNELFFCRLKNKRRKRKGSFSDSNSDFPKERTERRKRRKKKKAFHYEEDRVGTKKSKVRDFDEVRRNLLEKLKKQKAEQESKASAKDLPRERENSEIQEVDMLIDCTNYVDEARVAAPESSTEEADGIKEKEGDEKEDELDLTKLRLIALASNKKRKLEEDVQRTENMDSFAGEKKCFNGDRKDMDLDRNELLLRAEALKSALLKKHQKRLNRLKVKKADSFDDDLIGVASPPIDDGAKCARLRSADAEDAGPSRSPEGGGERERESGPGNPSVPTEGPGTEEKEMNGAVHQVSNANGKKCHPKARTKRKKSKSGSFGNSLKENQKSEALEEDDRTLRCQLLDDLIKKKSQKNLENNSITMDPPRMPDDKASTPPPVTSGEPPKDHTKPPPAVKTNSLRKINAAKASKFAAVLKIPKPEIQRIIVHLGSEDSSDEDVAPEGAQGEAASAREEEKESNRSEAGKLSDANKEGGKLIRADYERSVELLLSQARKKIEGERQSAKETLTTPEAVYKHLPPSQRLEYMRLKQKIAERERLKMRTREGKKENASAPFGPGPPGTSDPKGKESAESVWEKPKPGNLPKTDLKLPKSPSESSPLPNGADMNSRTGGAGHSSTVGGIAGASGTKSKEANQRLVGNKAKNHLVGFCGKGLKKSVAPPGNDLKAALPIQRSTLLLPSSQALISKLKLLLKKIKIEKMIEENYGKEISKLRTQLSLFERKQSEQRFKIKKLGEESMKTYKAIQGITTKLNEGKTVRKENGEKEKKEDVGEPKEEGTKPQEEEEGKNVSDEPVTEITKGQGKSEKGPNSIDKTSETGDDGTAFTPCFLKYSSPLQTFNKVVDCSKRVNPNVILCQFDLMGVCKDEECTYQHLRDS